MLSEAMKEAKMCTKGKINEIRITHTILTPSKTIERFKQNKYLQEKEKEGKEDQKGKESMQKIQNGKDIISTALASRSWEINLGKLDEFSIQ